jgi:hypothetical protein
MPQVRKLAPKEMQELQNKGKGQRKLIEEQYDAILSDYTTGDYGEALLESDEKRLTVHNRLRVAAERRGLGIEFRRTTGDLIRFQVVANDNGAHAVAAPAPEPVIEPEPAPKKRGGRPKKVS